MTGTSQGHAGHRRSSRWLAAMAIPACRDRARWLGAPRSQTPRRSSRPTPGPDRRPDTGPNPAPQKKNRPGGSAGSPAPNPPADRSTDSKSASIGSRSDRKPATETKTETPRATPATDSKAPPPTETSSGGGTGGGGGTSAEPKDDKKSSEGTKDSTLYAPYVPVPHWGRGMPNPEDDGSGGTGGPRAARAPWRRRRAHGWRGTPHLRRGRSRP